MKQDLTPEEQYDLDYEKATNNGRWILTRLLLPSTILLFLSFGLGFGGFDIAFGVGVLAAIGVGLSGVATMVLDIAGPDKAAVTRKHLTGTTVKRLQTPQKQDGVPLGNARMSEQQARVHTLIEGATGTGKTQLIKSAMRYIRQRGDTVVVVDTGGDLYKTFGEPDDIVLSLFDELSPGWMPANEVRMPSDWNALAQSLIGDAEGSEKQWNNMAKAMFAATAKGYQKYVDERGMPFDHQEFFYLLTSAPVDDIRPFLEGSAAASLADNDKGLANVRMSYFDTLSFWEDLRAGHFSLRDWVNTAPEQRGSIFIPHTKRTLPASKNVISCWLDQLITEASDAGPSDQRVWVIIDELSSLGMIPSLEVAVTELRKTGFRVVVGIQNYEQVQKQYGQHSATTITNNLSNKVIFRATSADAAERQSKLIGDARNRVTTLSSSEHNTERSYSTSDQVERVVLPSEILALPDLVAYIRLAGSDEVYLTEVPIYREE